MYEIFNFLLSFVFCYCQSSKVLPEDKLPVKIKTSTFQNWVGGQEQSGSGIIFTIIFDKKLPDNIKLFKIYYQKTEANFEESNSSKYIANLKFQPKLNLNLSQNPTIEYGNQTPVLKKNSFNLKNNEAILELKIINKTKFYKILNLKPLELLAYPKMRPTKHD